jgi:glycosyltransferase 2 family protein
MASPPSVSTVNSLPGRNSAIAQSDRLHAAEQHTLKLSRAAAYFGLVAKVLITSGAIWYLVTKVPLASVRSTLISASGTWLTAGVSSQILVRIVNAARIRIISGAQNAPLTYRMILGTLFTTAFYGLLLPGNLAAGAATLLKYLGHGASAAAALASIFVNRLLDTLTMVALGLIFFAVDRHSILNQEGLKIPVMLIGIALFCGGHALIFGPTRILHNAAQFFRRFDNGTFGRIRRGSLNVLDQCARAGNLRPVLVLAVFSLSLLKELLAVTVAYCFARAIDIDLHFVAVGWIQAATSLLLLLPISVSGLGVREGALALMSRPYGVDASDAVAWGLLLFGGLLCMAAIGGALEARSLWGAKLR